MAKTKDQFLRFRVIDRMLRKKSWVKTNTLKNAVEDVLMESISERAIQKDLEAMRDDTRLGFNAPIVYDKIKKAYKYSDRTYSILNFSLLEHEIHAMQFYASCLRIYSEYGVFKDFTNAIQKIVDGVTIRNKLTNKASSAQIIQTEASTKTPGVEYLERLIQAIDEKNVVTFFYKKFTSRTGKKRIVNPYVLREFRNRWYLTGFSVPDNDLRTFGLDRMSELKLAGELFATPKNFDAGDYFKNVYGVTKFNEPIEHIELWFSLDEAPYVRSLPIHPTQKIIRDNSKGLVITIDVIPSYELYELILSKSPHVKVLKPQNVTDGIRKKLTEAVKFYE